MINLKILKDFLRDQVNAGVTYARTHTQTHTHTHMLDQMMEPEKRIFILDVRRKHKPFRDAAHLFGTYELFFFFWSNFIEKFSNKLYFITTKAQLGLSWEVGAPVDESSPRQPKCLRSLR